MSDQAAPTVTMRSMDGHTVPAWVQQARATGYGRWCSLCGALVWDLNYGHTRLVRHLDAYHPGWRDA